MNAKGMTGFSLYACVVLAAGLSPTQRARGADPAPRVGSSAAALSAPLHFIANGGQTDARALFYAGTPGYTLWLTREGLVFDRVVKAGKGEPARSATVLKFEGANKGFAVVDADPSDYRVSYFYGREESEWKTDISTSRAVLYKSLYDGIDLKVYGTGREVEYDWIIAPGADPGRILFSYARDQAARLDGDGNLAVETPGGRIVHRKPSAYQIIEGRRVEVAASFRETENGAYGFAVGPYDPRRELVIDPLVLAFSTYLGGSDYDYALRVATDPTGAIYVCGGTQSKDFPPVTQKYPRDDLYITKLSSDGKSLVYTAFFPAGYGAELAGLAVDKLGFVYFAAATSNASFPVKNALQPEFKGGESDGFILKLARSGKSLVYSSYIGGESDEYCCGLAVDAAGAAYIGGTTFSRGFPTKSALQKTLGGNGDAFIAKVAPEGSSLVYSTFLGSSKLDECLDIASAADGAVIITGQTGSAGFPLASPFQKAFGGGWHDAFVTKLSPKGDKLVYSSFLGGNSRDVGIGLGADAGGAVYVVGMTEGSFPVKNAFQKTRGGARDAFLAKIAADGKSLAYATYLGGNGSDVAYEVAVDAAGSPYIVGDTESRNFPVKTPFQAGLRGRRDCFLTVFDASGRKLLSSTFLGGRYMDSVYGMALDANGDVLLSGMTNSPDFPVKYAYQKMFGGGNWDAFVLKFKPGGLGGAE